MSLFDSIISEAGKKFGLGDKSGSLLAILLAFMTDPNRGGFKGFLNRFGSAGLGDTASSWIAAGDNAPLSNEQVESVLSDEEIGEIAAQSDVDKQTATSALAFMIPQVVDKLTPDGVIPEESSLLSRIGDFLSGVGGVGAAAGAMATGAVDRVGTAAGDTLGAGKAAVGGSFDMIDAGANAVGEKTTAAFGDYDEGGSDNSILNWILPLLLLGLLVILGYWFCGRASTPVTTVGNINANANSNRPTNANANANTVAKTSDASFSLKATDGKYTATGVVPDEATRRQIVDALTAQYGAGNVNFDGLRIDASARPFAAGWWDNFSKLLPNLKDWKTGELSFVGNSITAAGLSQAAIDQIKSLFATDWKLPVSLAGAETAARQANEEALKELQAADSVEEVVKALNVSIINFASGKSDIPADAQPILAKAAEVLKNNQPGRSLKSAVIPTATATTKRI
jgi:OmpA-OmpF porin, OOP family